MNEGVRRNPFFGSIWYSCLGREETRPSPIHLRVMTGAFAFWRDGWTLMHELMNDHGSGYGGVSISLCWRLYAPLDF